MKASQKFLWKLQHLRSSYYHRYSGCRDAIIQDVTGILVKKYSSTEIANAISFLKDNEKIRKNGAGRKKISRKKI